MSGRIQDFDKLSPAKQKLLLARLRKREEAEARSEGIPRSPRRDPDGTGGGPFPLSFAQQRLWFIDRLDPGAATYNLSDALLLEGRLDVPALERTLGEIVRRHEALRTVFDVVEGKAVQWVAPPSPEARFPLSITDLSGLEVERAPELANIEARRLAEAEAILPFDVPRGPHLRAGLVRLPRSGSQERWLALLSMHHIVSDGWSMGVLVRELGALYGAFASGRRADLPAVLEALPIQYPDFADWQRRTLQGETLEEHLRWWRERLAGAPPFLDLPADHPRPAVARHQGANFQVSLPADLSAALAGLARERGATPFMVLLAAFAVLLSRHAGQEDVIVGSPVANRNRLETEGLIGFFVNTLVLRVDAAERPGRTFLDLLDEVRATTLGAYAHQDLPFERIVEELRPERDLSRPPLFQVSLVWQNTPAGDLELPDLTLGGLHLPARSSVVDLSVEAAELGGEIFADWRFDTDLFDEPTVRRLADRFAVLLRAVVTEPSRPLLDLPMLTEAERQGLAAWSAGPEPGPAPLVPDLFAARAAERPEDEALVSGDETWTYRELAERAWTLAAWLRRLGAGRETRVGISVERSPGLVASLLGALSAGAPFVPLDAAYPAERLAWMAADAGIDVLITTGDLAGRFPVPEGARTLLLEEIAGGAAERPAVSIEREDLAYVLYTSGSTGRPKGVMVTHGGMANLAAAQRSLVGAGPGARVLQFASPSFDASILELLAALTTGASFRVAPREALLPGPDLARRLDAWKITHALLFPPVLTVTPSAGDPGPVCVISGGEALPSAVAARWAAGRRLVNLYGPTEATVCATAAVFADGAEIPLRVPIGRPVAGHAVWVLDRALRRAPVGVPGELWIGGAGLARGYQGRPDLTAERFLPHPFAEEPGARLYRTGDLVRWRTDLQLGGFLDFLGRIDRQVKVRGVRIEPGEIETALAEHPEVREVVVAVRTMAGDPRLVAWVVLDPASRAEPGALRAWLAGRLPEALIPAAIVPVPAIPVTSAGKIDREALPAPGSAQPLHAPVPLAGLEADLAALWREVLGLEHVGREESFFDLGGHSLLLVELQSRLRDRLGEEVPLLELFRHPTIRDLALYLTKAPEPELLVPVRRTPPADPGSRDVAVLGLACRFPEAASVEDFWRNLRAGLESIRVFSRDELLAAGADPARLDDPAYVPANGVLEGAELFDAGFFDIGPREAQILDPQHRIFLECAAEALERAGYGAGSPALAGARVGVWAGAGMSTYGVGIVGQPGIDAFEATLGNDKDFLATRTAYELDLRGPAVTVQTACSTSLVAVHSACRALLDGECELALAGGVTIEFPQTSGYLWREGGIASPDGHNRAFDAKAGGTVGGNGAGVVLLKPLAVALAEGDPVRAVIRATALNNDGSGKIGFTAPSEQAQAEVIATAQELAGVPPETIGYVEAHGSATNLGDPIEVAALARAFRARATGALPPGGVALGSVKTNVGHTGSAAGVAGLLKTVLALEHGEIPPSLWYEQPNPRIDFASGPFRVPTALEPWPAEPGIPRRAGVSSFGLGGTNAHVILEEAPERAPSGTGRGRALIALSARTATALETATGQLAEHLRQGPGENLSDVAFTLLVGRKAHEHRRVVVAESLLDAAEALRDPKRALSGVVSGPPRPVAFVLAGLGEQYPGLARGLYDEEPVFREELDRCAELLTPRLGIDIREALFAGAEERQGGAPDLRRLLGRAGKPTELGPLDRTEILQPALFAVEYALARLWISWGVRPSALAGYSLGEYVAACLAGVFSLEDALWLVTERARWIAELPAGAMLAVPLTEEELAPWLAGTDLDLAAINGPHTCVVAGPVEAVASLERRMAGSGLPARRLRTTHAFHSRAMHPVAERLTALVREIGPRPPRIPLLSNVTGTWMPAEQATDPAAWAAHLLRPVRFAEAVAELWREPGRLLLEIGPGQSLGSLALQHPAAAEAVDPVALPSLPAAFDRKPDLEIVLGTLGKLWLAGAEIDPRAVWAREERRRVELPTYPFERQRFFIEPALPALPATAIDSFARETEALREAAREAAGLADPERLRTLLAEIETRATALSERLALLRGGAATEEPTRSAVPSVIELHPRPGLRNAYVEPVDELERRVAGLWQRLLGIDRIGRHDSFFDLGGDSLLATQGMTRVRDAFGVEIPLPSFFEDPTPAGVAALIARLRPVAGQETVREPIPRQPRDGRVFPLSFGQERLWVIHEIEPRGTAYNLPAGLRLAGRLDVGVLARVLGEVVRRHEALRTTFAKREGRPVQIVHPAAPFPVPRVDLGSLPAAARETEARRLAAEDVERPFDLIRGPVLRVLLLRLAPEEHALLLDVHHIASDGWSQGVLVEEVAALYGAFAAGRPSPLPEPPVQYADFAVWQRGRAGLLEESLGFWKRQLAGAPPLLELPTDRPRPAVQGTEGDSLLARWSPELTASLEALARDRHEGGATLFMVLLAAVQTLLLRLSGQSDVSVGSPIANRQRTEVEPLIGFFVNTLVLRTDLSGDPGFRELLGRVRRVALEAYAHQDVPFSQVVEAVQPERSLAHAPLFQVLFALQNAPAGRLEIPGLALEPFEAPVRTAMFDLTLSAFETPEGLAFSIEYRTDLFDGTTAARWLGHLETLLHGIAAAPDRALADLPLLREAERFQLLTEWSQPETLFPGDEILPVLLSRQVAAAPDAPALAETEGAGRRMTYGGLWHRVLRLAWRLRALGVGPEVCVGICLERSVEQVIAALAVIQAGGAYVPLDPAHPRERLALMIENTGAPVVIALEPLLPSLPEIAGLRVLCLDRDRAEIDRERAEPFDSGATADTLAYVMYTSGSTGTPKGVAIPHRGIARLARWCREIGIGAGDSFFFFAPFAFDLSTLDIWGTFLNGARLVVPPAGPASLEEIGGWVESHGVSVLWLTAGLFHQMAEAKPGGALDRLAGLRFLMAGGDALSVPHVRQVLERLPKVVMVNGYGPTENTTFTTCHVMRGPQPFATSVPLGRPIDGTRVVVLDRGWRPVPLGVAGELCTGGAGLARGYVGRPDLTAHVFVPDAWTTDQPGERLYRTGDLARFLADGRLEFLGRIDQQVKIRGFRVEPGEIETALASHPEVGACSVVVGRDTAGKRLVACVAPRDPQAPPAAAELRDWLAERLPDPMIPAAFLVLDALPLTANGKVDRRALLRLLPEPGAARDTGQEAPRTPVERRLAALWTDLLGETRVGLRGDFFALGGHSLLATQLVSRVRDTFGVEIPLRTVFEAPTLAGLAGRIEAAAERAGAVLLAPIERVPGEGPFPLSFSQERLWLLDQIEPGSSAYNMPAALRLEGELRPGLLAAVLGEIVRRHAALRTTYPLVDGAPAQVLAPASPFSLPLVDLSGLEAERGVEEGRRLAAEETLRPFDLARDPMLRSLLVRFPEDHLLLCTMHHIASDGWSIEVFVREVLALYAAFSKGRPSPLPELPVRYADYAVWQRRVLQGEALDEGLAYWRGQLAGIPALELPVDRPWHPGAGNEAGRASFELPAALTGRLKAFGQSEGATLFMVLLAAFQTLLARAARQTDVAVGTSVAGRDRTELEGLIGFFVNTLVLRTDLGGDPGFRELLARVRDTALAALAHQQIPFEKLVAELSPERSLARTPFFQAMFVLMSGESSVLEVPGLTVTPFESGVAAAKFDLSLSLREVNGGLLADLEYRAALFDAATIHRLRDDFLALLAEVVEDPVRPLLAAAPEPGQPAPRPPRAPEPARAWEAPRTAVERRLAELWADLLGGGPVGVHDDFFRLGGHSLLGTQLVSHLREVFGVEIPLRALFEAPTLAGFAARIEAASDRPAGSPASRLALAPIQRVPRDGQPLPLSFAQERLWFLDELDPGTPTLNMPFSARLSTPLDDAVLARALGEVVRRHESLRTTFGSEGGRPYQRIAPFQPVPLPPVPLPVVDLRGLAPALRLEETRRLEAEEELAPFDLAHGPLLRTRLIRLGETDRRLLITLHHVISDGWSLGLLMRELTALYRAFTEGRPSPLPELPIQYADYAAWQRRWLAGEALEAQIAYWRSKLGDPAKPLPVLDLPTDRPRPAVQSWRGAALSHLLDSGLTGRLAALAHREGATLFMLLLAGFQALLARWSGQDDVVVGTPVAGRVRAETEGLIGCFLNNLALRTDLAGEPTFRALLGRVRATALEAYAHQDVPFEKLLEELRVERDLSRTPLFQVFLNMLNFPAEEGALDGGGEETGPPEVPSKFDLTIYATETVAGLRLDLVYNSDLFDRARMAELAAQLELLLSHVAEAPETRIGEIPLLTPAARAVLPDPARPLPRAWLGPVAERVAEHARLHPEAPAVADRAGTWTYGQLDAHSGRLAARLREAGIGTGDVVAVFAHRGAALAAALLGVWRSGAAFAILDPAYPPARLAAIVNLVRPGAFLLLEAAGVPPVEVEETIQGIPRITLPEREAGWPALGAAVEAFGAEIGPDDLAYVAFTSGSTGTPKGILGTHAPLSHFFDWHARTFGLTAEDRFSVLSGLAHDPLLRDLFAPLWIGATLHVPDPDEMGDPGRLAGWMARERVTVAHLTPAMGQLLAQGPPTGLPDLRRAFFGGDALTGADLARLTALAPRVEVVNFYGATETPQAMGWWGADWKETGPREAGRVPLGRGIDGVQLLVLNLAGHLSGIGELGEIAIRTPYLALGYLGDPAATAERFTSDPLAVGEDVRAYRTGDLGRYRPDGAVTFAGRADAQVKIRGFRVEIGEIEAALLRHPAVREAAVILGEGPDHPLLAFVVLAPGAEAPDLRLLLRGQLPAYMMPAAVVLLEHLPLTPNRKVDRRALARAAGELVQPVAAEGARGPVEEALAGFWGELLGTDPARIGIHQDFFDLGGHSLLAAQLLARIWDQFQIELPLRALFERPTIAGMAELLAISAGPASVVPPLIRRELGPADEPPPLSFAQQRLWFLHQLEPESPAYNLPFAQRLAGPLDARALVRAFAEVTRRHEVLRTRYAAVDGDPVQVIDPLRDGRTILPLIDLADLPETAREAEAAAWVRRESRAPFDLAAEHPLRARLLRLGPASHVLALTLHHIASDGWSNGILVSELAELYRAFAAGRSATLPELAVQYADFAVWQRRAFEAGALDGQRAYWRERLGDPPPPLELPTDRPRPVVPTHAGGHHGVDLPAALADALSDLGRSRGATLFMTLLAGWAALLARYSGQDDLTIGTPVAGRTRVEVEPLIGFFVNTLVIRADLSGDPPFAELLDRVREAALGAFGHQDLPFEELVEELRPERDLSHPPLFQVMFVLQNAPIEALEVAGLTFQALPAETGAATFDLTLSLSTAGGGFGGMLQFKSDLFEASTIDRLLGHFRVLLTAAAARPEERLGDLPLLTPVEREQLLGVWNDTAAPWPDDVCLHELFERQVDRSPDAIALVVAATGEEISYRELDARAGRLAGWLRAHGVGPEVSVGVAMERSPELVVALLAVLKAGGAWLPLDPSSPPDRLSFLLEDAAVAVLLTREDLPQGEATAPARLASGVTPDHLAYRIYTSGSTGRPKGVLVPHRAIVNHMRWLQRDWPLGPSDVVLQIFAPSFDASFTDLWAPLLAGARLILPTAESLRDSALLAEEIVHFGATRFGSVPSWHAEMVDRPLFASAPALRQLLAGGQELPGALAERLARGGREVVNFYGPTEAAVTASIWRFTPGSGERIVPIGRPIANTRVYILGSAAEPSPAGVPGELCIGGAGVARGYGGRPDLTADRFRPDPFAEAGARLYRTGDRARWRADGVLEFLGRVDRQVKVRGFRIEPGEIEAVLARHPLLREAAVVARGTRGAHGGDLRLIAYVVARQPVAPEDLRAWLAARLPEPMLPASWVFLETLPRTPNGKVDLAALPEPERVLPTEGQDRVAPRDALETELAAIWEELLDLRPIGVRDDFFALGGHSLLVLRLLARIEKRLGRTLTPAAIFAAPTIEDLAHLLREEETSSGPLVRLHPGGDQPPLVWVHAAAGTVTAYAEVARRLREADPERPVWALQVAAPLPESLEALAARHASALREAWPAGPYLLAGWSFGGVVAFEMARQLRAEGAEVALTVLVDTRAPGVLEIPRDVPSLLATFAADQNLPPDLDLADREALRPLFETFREHLGLLAAYRPAPSPGRIVLFRAADNPVPAPPDLGWEPFVAGELEIRPLPGDHAGAIHGEGAGRLVAEILARLA